jgi:hypothetical protein
MKVMCIQAFEYYKGFEDIPLPVVTDVDEVTGIEEMYGYKFYELKRFGKEPLYRADHFAIIPDADADEIEDAEKEAIVPSPEPTVVHNSNLHPIFLNILNGYIAH